MGRSARSSFALLDARTLITFGDTSYSEVAPDGRRLDGTTMVANSCALLTGARPRPGAIELSFGADGDGRPAARVVLGPRFPRLALR